MSLYDEFDAPEPARGEHTDRLAWLAFQYVADELPAGEAAALELLMEHDQQAREAVAEAVLLWQATSAAEARPAPAIAESRGWSLPLAWAAMGAAVCLAIIFAGQWYQQAENEMAENPAAEPPAPVATADLTEEELALAWATSFLMSEGNLGSSYGASSNNSTLGPDPFSTDNEVDLAGDVEPGVAVPAWMYEAVHGTEQPQDGASEREDS